MNDEVLGKEREGVLAMFGLAMLHAQGIERGMALLLAVRTTPSDATRDSLEDRAAENVALTFGLLLERLKLHLTDEPQLLAKLTALRPRRDRLAHQFFTENEIELHTADGLAEMARELAKDIRDFSRAKRTLYRLLMTFLMSRGGTEEELNKRVAEALRRGTSLAGPPRALPRRVTLTGMSLYVPRPEHPDEHFPVFRTEDGLLLVVGDRGLCRSTSPLDAMNLHELTVEADVFPADVVVHPKGARDHNFEIPLRAGHKLVVETNPAGEVGVMIVPSKGKRGKRRGAPDRDG